MKKRLLILGLVMMLVLTGCGKDKKGYKEKVYTPIQENVKILEDTMKEYTEKANNTIAKSENKEDLSFKNFYENIDTMKENISKIEPLDSFSDEEKKQFESIIENFENAVDNIKDTSVNLIGIFVLGGTEQNIKIYENANEMSNKYIDNFIEEYKALNKEYGINEEVNIKDRTFSLMDLTKNVEPLTEAEENKLTIYLESFNTGAAGNVVATVDRENRTVALAVKANLKVAATESAIQSAVSVGSKLKELGFDKLIISEFFEDDKENPLIVVYNGTLIAENYEDYLKEHPEKDAR